MNVYAALVVIGREQQRLFAEHEYRRAAENMRSDDSRASIDEAHAAGDGWKGLLRVGHCSSSVVPHPRVFLSVEGAGVPCSPAVKRKGEAFVSRSFSARPTAGLIPVKYRRNTGVAVLCYFRFLVRNEAITGSYDGNTGSAAFCSRPAEPAARKRSLLNTAKIQREIAKGRSISGFIKNRLTMYCRLDHLTRAKDVGAPYAVTEQLFRDANTPINWRFFAFMLDLRS
jgi:hypothetical protein